MNPFITPNSISGNILLEELVEFSQTTGKPVHEYLGVTKEKLDEWIEEYKKLGTKPMLEVRVPDFGMEEK